MPPLPSKIMLDVITISLIGVPETPVEWNLYCPFLIIITPGSPSIVRFDPKGISLFRL